MWLMPCSSSTSRARSATSWDTLPSAAAPKITRVESCPVAPNGLRSIMEGSLGPGSRLAAAEDPLLQPRGPKGPARIQPFLEPDEVGVAVVQLADRRGVGGEELAPVWPRAEGGKRAL